MLCVCSPHRVEERDQLIEQLHEAVLAKEAVDEQLRLSEEHQLSTEQSCGVLTSRLSEAEDTITMLRGFMHRRGEASTLCI